MQYSINLTNHCLIAMPNLADPNFHRAVTYICQHDEHGAVGLILNQMTDMRLHELLQQLDIQLKPEAAQNTNVMFGGPVDIQSGFILHRPVGNWETTMPVTDEIGLTTSLDVLRAIADGSGPTNSIIALGYAGWSGGQLESELMNNAWLTLVANPDLLFNTAPEHLWHAAAKTLGIDISRLSSEAGHA